MEIREQCKICKVEYPSSSNQVLRTEDNENICLFCYHSVWDILFKGTFTLKEAEDTVEKLRDYNETLDRYLLPFKKYAFYYKDTSIIILDKILRIEEELCLTLFKKHRASFVFHKLDHLLLMKLILQDSSNIMANIYDSIDIDKISLGLTTKDNSKELEDIHKLKALYMNTV